MVSAGTKDPANCTITVAAADLLAITTGKLSGQMAFMTGKLKISGDMGLAMKLQKILG
ncbi:MAG: SCP2 sterol-binding domain-containing protein [Deltaproteobacteria bacterium]|nr:SCP2 sterol-binding domain-containing protein [Deltaproteobacteria bacterium]